MNQLRLIGFMEANFFALIVLLLIYLNTRRHMYKYDFEQKLYTYLIFINAFMLTIDIIRMYADGKSGNLMYTLNLTAAILTFVCTPIIAMFWSIYVDYKIFINRKKIKKEIKFMAIISVVNLIILIVSSLGLLGGKIVFSIDANNVYHRGELHKVPIILSYIYIMYSVISIEKNRKIMDESDYKSLRVFSVPPIIGGIIQSLLSGVKLTWISMTLSIFIIFANLQNNLLHVDVLTGLYNRRNLEKYLTNVFLQFNNCKVIGGILLDINDFKDINDKYGHDEGDRALVALAKILKTSFEREDFVFRYAGDEFVVVCEVEDFKELESRIKKLDLAIDDFNSTSSKPYEISVSRGYDVFLSNSRITDEAFIRKIDALMYQDKEEYRERKLLEAH